MNPLAEIPLAFWFGMAAAIVLLLAALGLWTLLRKLPFLDRGDD